MDSQQQFENNNKLSAREIQQDFYNYFGYKNEIIWDCYGRDLKDALRRKIDLIFPSISITINNSDQDKIDNIENDNNNNNNNNNNNDGNKILVNKDNENNNSVPKNDESLNDSDGFILINKSIDTDDAKTNSGTESGIDKLNKYKEKIVEAIWSQRKYNDGILLMAPIFIVCVRDSSENESSTEYSIHPVFRVKKCHSRTKKNNSRNCCMIFVDENARVYQNWEDYIKNNNLPDSFIIAPKYGIYNSDETDNVLLEKCWSPAHQIGTKIFKVTDISTSVVGFTLSGISIAAITIPSIILAPPLLIGATAVGLGCGAYSLGRGIYNLMDRSNHEQTLKISDAQARACWFEIAGSAVGIGAGTITRGISLLTKSGSDISKIISGGINLLNISSITVNGAAVVNGFVGFLYNNHHNDKKMSTFDILELEASLFLFTHSLYNFQIADFILTLLKQETISEFKDFLTGYQRKMFDKMNKETLNIKNVNKKTVTDVPDASNSNNDDDSLDSLDIIRSLKNIPDNENYFNKIYKECCTKDFDKVKNFENFEIINEHINLILDNNNNNNFRVLSELNLKSSLKIYSNCLTIDSFQIFLATVKSFVREYGNKVQYDIKRFIPFEQFLDDCFKIFYTLANQKLDELNELILHINNFEVAYNCIIIYYYEQYDSNNEPNINCSICNGQYY